MERDQRLDLPLIGGALLPADYGCEGASGAPGTSKNSSSG